MIVERTNKAGKYEEENAPLGMGSRYLGTSFLFGIIVTAAPFLNFYPERLRELDVLLNPRSFLWSAGVLIFYTGAFLLSKSTRADGRTES
jgi:hypothetical protein